MAKAIFSRRFDATDTRRGVSVRVPASSDPQTVPGWVIDLAVEAGAAVRVPRNITITSQEDITDGPS